MLGLLVALLAAGCATHAEKRAEMERAMSRGDYAAALQELDKKHKNPENVLYLLDRGLLLHYLGRHAESNVEFEAAEVRIQDLYTRSLSKEAAALVTSDNVIPYDGAPFERALIHYYRTMNYLHADDVEGALVECRKANLLLAEIAGKTEGKKTAYQDDPFLQYLTAMLYEDAGEWNDAWVSLRSAEEAYERSAEVFGVEAPATLGGDLRRLARGFGDVADYEMYSAKYPEACDTVAAGSGELVLLFENGLAPFKQQIDIALPILKTDRDRYRDRDEFALVVANRWNGYSYEDAELDYLLRIAVPKLKTRPPLVRAAEVRVGDAAARTAVVEDVAALSEAALSEAMPKILLKTVLRGLAKYLTTRGVEKEAGEVGGFIANILTAATERADTRGWITLPNDIQMARLSLPAGEHRVTLRFLGRGDDLIASADAGIVTIEPGRRTYLTWRGWE